MEVLLLYPRQSADLSEREDPRVKCIAESNHEAQDPFAMVISVAQWVQRNWRSFYPEESPKHPEALRLGLLGASKIAYVSSHFVDAGSEIRLAS